MSLSVVKTGNKNTSHRLEVPKSVSDLQIWLANENLGVDINVIFIGHECWNKEDQVWEPTGPLPEEKRPLVPDKYIKIHFSFNSAKQVSCMSDLALTYDHEKTLTLTPVNEHKKLYAYYGKSGFDEAFEATKKLKPSLTREKFAKFGGTHYDDDLVAVRAFKECGNIGEPIMNLDNEKFSHYRVAFCITYPNLDRNLEALKKIFKDSAQR